MIANRRLNLAARLDIVENHDAVVPNMWNPVENIAGNPSITVIPINPE